MSEINKPDTKAVALWMLVGWQKCWMAAEVFDALGFQPDWIHLHDDYPMFPEFTRPKTPVRAVITENFPRLAERLDRGIKTKEQADALIELLSKKVASKVSSAYSASEYREFNKTSRDYKISEAERAGYAKRNDIGPFGWKVCR